MKKNNLLATLGLVSVITLAACGSDATNASEKTTTRNKKQPKKKQILLVMTAKRKTVRKMLMREIGNTKSEI